MAFDADVFEATACTQGSDWKAAWGCTRNDPVDRVLIVGSSKASTARGTAVLIATFTLRVKSTFTDAQLSPISGNIEVGGVIENNHYTDVESPRPPLPSPPPLLPSLHPFLLLLLLLPFYIILLLSLLLMRA